MLESVFPTFIFLKFSRALSVSGVSSQPVSVQELLLLSVQLFSGRLSTSGDLSSTNFCGSLYKHPQFKMLQERQLPDHFIHLPRLRAECGVSSQPHDDCLQLVYLNMRWQIITTNSFIKLTGDKTERAYRSVKCCSYCPKCLMLKYVRDTMTLTFLIRSQA